jgi:hypothetical protein
MIYFNRSLKPIRKVRGDAKESKGVRAASTLELKTFSATA